MITLRPISPGDQAILRDLRLRALQDAPTAFGSNYARESDFADAEWLQRVTKATTPGIGVMFFAHGGDAYCGIIGCFKDAEIPARAWIVSMWVAPEARRQGVGSRLLQAAEDWARENRFRELALDVTESNTAAMTLYQRCGFRFTGETDQNPNDPALRELRMIKRIENDRIP